MARSQPTMAGHPRAGGARPNMLRCRKRQGEATMGKRLAIVAALTCATLLAGFAARADDYPNRPIRVVVGFSAGSGADITARVVGQRLGQNLGQPIVGEKKGRGGTAPPARVGPRAPQDGDTLPVGG